MALTDPQSVTISTVAKSLPRIGMSLNESDYQSADGTVKMTIRHDSSRRNRHIVKLQKSLIVADPLFPSQNQTVSYSATLTIDTPKNGAVAADFAALADALVLWATPATTLKVAGGEI